MESENDVKTIQEAFVNPSEKQFVIEETRYSVMVLFIPPVKQVMEKVYNFGSVYVSGKLPTYPSPSLTFCPK